jgi:hypothetical protein
MVTVGNEFVDYPSWRKKRAVLSIPSVRSLVIPLRNTLVRASFPYPTGPSTDASFKAELLARMRHCQPFIFDLTASALPRRLRVSTLATAPHRLGSAQVLRLIGSIELR